METGWILVNLLSAIQYLLRDQKIDSPKIRNSIDSLWRAINQSTVRSKFGEEIFQSFARETFLGLSIWIPKRMDTYALRKEELNNSTLYRELKPYSKRETFLIFKRGKNKAKARLF